MVNKRQMNGYLAANHGRKVGRPANSWNAIRN